MPRVASEDHRYGAGKVPGDQGRPLAMNRSGRRAERFMQCLAARYGATVTFSRFSSSSGEDLKPFTPSLTALVWFWL